MQSLLGQFYNRIKGSQEDIASEGLAYILKQSFSARQVINQIIENKTGLKLSDLKYSTQNVGEKLERPDICGNDENGNEVLIIEAKFWASLTSNQPNEYLNRLDTNSVLLFLCPTLRVGNVLEEVQNRIGEKQINFKTDIENKKIQLIDANNFILFLNWNDLLNSLKDRLIQENNHVLISDVNQIIGFCDTIDSNSFHPITDDDLSPKIAKAISSYYDIVDKVVDDFKNKNTTTKILNRTPQKNGYHRYFTNNNLGLAMCLRFDNWESNADTPFWLNVKELEADEKWSVSNSFRVKCEKIAQLLNIKFAERNNEIFLSLKPKVNETEDVVINNLTAQIELIISKID